MLLLLLLLLMRVLLRLRIRLRIRLRLRLSPTSATRLALLVHEPGSMGTFAYEGGELRFTIRNRGGLA